MEIIFNAQERGSNFTYASELFKGKKVLNGFNKLNEVFESLDSDEFYCNDLIFKKPLEADLIIDYPLSVVVKQHVNVNTLHELITEIRKTYQDIYREERLTSDVKEQSIDEATHGRIPMLNRVKTTGKYGIWGHDLEDLSISSIRVLEGNLIELGIDS